MYKCFVCGSHTKKVSLKISSQVRIEQCKACGLAFTLPAPFRFDYRNTSHAPIQVLHNGDRVLQRLPAEYINMIDNQADLINVYQASTNNVVDIGCGTGLLLQRLIKDGHSCYGVEISNVSRDFCHAQGLRVVEVLTELPRAVVFGSTIILSHVIEHMNAPVDALSQIVQYARPNYIILTQANYSSLNRKLMRAKWPALDCNQHFFHFSAINLKAMMNKLGFTLEKCIYSDIVPVTRLQKIVQVLTHPFPPAKEQFTLLLRSSDK